jgi:hypothetical protein
MCESFLELIKKMARDSLDPTGNTNWDYEMSLVLDE